MSSLVVWGLPILAPFALAFAIPDLTLALVIANSSWLNTPAICKKTSVIGSACPLRQSIVMLPKITSLMRFCLIRSNTPHGKYHSPYFVYAKITAFPIGIDYFLY